MYNNNDEWNSEVINEIFDDNEKTTPNVVRVSIKNHKDKYNSLKNKTTKIENEIRKHQNEIKQLKVKEQRMFCEIEKHKWIYKSLDEKYKLWFPDWKLELLNEKKKEV